MKLPRPTLLGILAFINFATAGVGISLTGPGGKLALSNLTPIPFIAFAAVPFITSTEGMPRRFFRYLLLFNVGCVLSFAIFLVRFGWPPNLLVLLFQDVEILFCALLILYAKDHWPEFRTAVRWGIYASVPITLYFGYEDHLASTGPLQFGMDDKSQAAVFLCMEAFILARFFRSGFDAVLCVGLVGLSFLTVSRLPVFFLPAILASVATRSRFGFAFVTLLLCAAGGIFTAYAPEILKLFGVLSRLSSLNALDSNSTISHVTLLRSALSIKFSDPLAFFFGTGPGNFSEALTSFQPPDLQTLQAVDPKLVAAAYGGEAPLHSTPFQLLLDYSLPTLLLVAYGVYRALSRLAIALTLVDWLFIGGLFTASMFYSIHDKHYFFLLGITVALFISRRIGEVHPCDAYGEQQRAPAATAIDARPI